MSFRIERLNSEMTKSIADIIENRLSDPRITEMVTVTGVNVAKDLKTAKVHVSIFGEEERAKACLDILAGSAGFIRKELAKDFKNIRTVPQITFMLDTSFEYARKIDSILDSIKKNDAD